MNLNDVSKFKGIDRSNMLMELQGIPVQLESAWELGKQYPLPKKKDYEHVILAGMGGSAIGADILKAYAQPISNVAISVVRGYDLPEFVKRQQCLVICSSHSGNTEETRSVFDQALSRECELMAVSTGGELENLAKRAKVNFWKFEHKGQPRAAIGYSFGLLYCLFSRLSIIADQKNDMDVVVASLREDVKNLDVTVPAEKNPAKRIAGQALNRALVFFGAEHLEPVARRWKTQVNELAKAWAGFEFLPEADHNSLAGLENPEDVLQKLYAVFLNSNYYHKRNQKRFQLTSQEYMVSGVCTDQVSVQATSRLDEIWRLVLLGDFVSYYLAMAYQEDPTPIERLESFKKSMLQN